MKGIVRIRFSRFGRKRAPVYNIVVTKAESARDKTPLEVLGVYNPIPRPIPEELKKQGVRPVKDVELDFQRAKYWLGVGAQPTKPVEKLLKKAGILNPEWPQPSRVLKPIGDKVVMGKRELEE